MSDTSNEMPPPPPTEEENELAANLAQVDLEDGENDENDENEASEPRYVLEDFTRCSESHLWKLMMSFYDRKGPESWSEGIVPHFITSNAHIGRAYAKVLLGFLEDIMKHKEEIMQASPEEPFYIIELGTGSGKFSFFMLKALMEFETVSSFPLSNICYVMTDFTESNFKYWQDHPSLSPFFNRGILDAGIFNAGSDNGIQLWKRERTLSPDNPAKNPMCVVANYLFDTLCHDAFQIHDGKLFEGLVSTGSSENEEEDHLNPDIIERMENEWRYDEITTDYYDDKEDASITPTLKLMLDFYLSYFGQSEEGASILIPIGAIRAIKKLSQCSEQGILIISGDKGNNHIDHFCGLGDPHIATHGSFSVMVNYHAIGLMCSATRHVKSGTGRQLAGFSIHSPQEEASLSVSTFLVVNDHGAYDDDTLRSILFSTPSNEEAGEEAKDNVLVEKEKQEQQKRLNLCTSYQEKLQLYNEETSITFYPHVSVAFREYVTYFGPNDFFVLQKTVKEDGSHGLSLKSVLAILKLSDWDPDVFYKYRDPILNQISSCGYKLKEDMRRGMERVWEQYYLLDFDKDIAFEIGRFYYGIHHYNKAIEYYTISHEVIGEHHVTYHNLGLCYYSMRSYEKAIEFFDKAIAVNENYEKAKQWKEKVEKEVYGTKATEGDEQKQDSSDVPSYRPVYNVNDSEEEDSSDDDDDDNTTTNNNASNTNTKKKSEYPTGYVSLSDSGEDTSDDDDDDDDDDDEDNAA